MLFEKQSAFERNVVFDKQFDQIMINCDQNYEITIMELTLYIIILKLMCKKNKGPEFCQEWLNGKTPIIYTMAYNDNASVKKLSKFSEKCSTVESRSLELAGTGEICSRDR